MIIKYVFPVFRSNCLRGHVPGICVVQHGISRSHSTCSVRLTPQELAKFLQNIYNNALISNWIKQWKLVFHRTNCNMSCAHRLKGIFCARTFLRSVNGNKLHAYSAFSILPLHYMYTYLYVWFFFNILRLQLLQFFADFSFPQNTAKIRQRQKIDFIRYLTGISYLGIRNFST
jgi:hypothetical protein